jgi:hypothetical protein
MEEQRTAWEIVKANHVLAIHNEAQFLAYLTVSGVQDPAASSPSLYSRMGLAYLVSRGKQTLPACNPIPPDRVPHLSNPPTGSGRHHRLPNQRCSPYLSGRVGSTTIDIINVTALGGFTGTVDLQLAYPPNVVASYYPYSVTIGPTFISNSSQLLMQSNTPGLYKLNLTGTQGLLSHKITVTFQVNPLTANDLGLYASFPLNVVRGTSATANIGLDGILSFAGTIDLRVGEIPEGLVTSLSLYAVTIPYSSPPTAASSELTITAPSTIPLGTYLVVVVATSGSLAHMGVITVVVEAVYSTSATPDTLNMVQGTGSASTISVSGQGGYDGSISLSIVPNYDSQHLTVSLNPTTVQLSATASTASSTLTVQVAPLTPSGNYVVNVNSTDGKTYHLTQVTAVVVGVDYSISAYPSSLTFQQGIADIQTLTVSVTSLNGFSGSVNLTSTVFSAYLSPQGIILTPNSTMVALNAGDTKTFTLTVTVQSNAIIGEHPIEIKATAKVDNIPLVHYIYPPATVGPDFTMNASAASLTVHKGSLGMVTITFASLNGFSGGLRLEDSPLTVQPPNPRRYGFPWYPILTAGGTNNTEFAVIADNYTGLGIYDIWIDASSDNPQSQVSHRVYLTIVIQSPVAGPDFTLSAQSSHVDMSIGSTTTSVVSLTSINGFSGTLSLQVEDYGVFGSLTQNSVTVDPAFSASFTLTITAPTPYQIDGYPLWYPASGGRSLLVIASDSTGFSHWIWVNETIAPVSVVLSPIQLEISIRLSATSQILLTSLSGFNLTVAMSTVISPSGLTTSLSNNFINFSASTAPVSLDLTVNVPSAAPKGDYVVQVTATSMSHQWFCQCGYYNITYTTPIYVRAVAPSSPPSGPGPSPSPQPNGSAGIFGLPTTEFYGIIGVAAAAMVLVISVGYLRFRRRKAVIK